MQEILEGGKYQIIQKIATGGMAEIFLAIQRSIEGFERFVVIKRLHEFRTNDTEFITMFLDEARLIAKFSHPNIAQLYDIGYDGDSYYLVLEYVHGVNLASIIDNYYGILPLNFTLPIIYAACEALNYIHNLTDEYGNSLNIVHRDINPQNILISYSGAVKLIDFGIAKAKTQYYETKTGIIKGTYGYMAPEQITKKVTVGPYTDLFALGVILYEMTTGKHPFNAKTEVEIFKMILSGRFTKPSAIVPNYPQELEELIINLLKTNPAERIGSAQEVQSKLEIFMEKNGIFYSTKNIAKALHEILEYEQPIKRLQLQQNKILVTYDEEKKKTQARSTTKSEAKTQVVRIKKKEKIRKKQFFYLIIIVILILLFLFSITFSLYWFIGSFPL